MKKIQCRQIRIDILVHPAIKIALIGKLSYHLKIFERSWIISICSDHLYNITLTSLGRYKKYVYVRERFSIFAVLLYRNLSSPISWPNLTENLNLSLRLR